MIRIPPQVLVLLAIVAIQLGAALATQLFPLLGATGTVATRILISAIILVIFARRKIRKFGHTFLQHWQLLIALGVCIAAMNMFFYLSIARIPLGAAVALEFAGPLGVAAMTSRQLNHLGWVALAGTGIILLSPLSGMELELAGVIFALLAGAGWALFILISGRVGRQLLDNDGLVIGMVVAAVVVLPFFTPVIPELISNPKVLLTAFSVAVLSTTIPFSLEFQALKQLSTRAYGILVSLEPGVAALVGALLLSEYIGFQGLIAVTCVVIAAIGITLTDNRDVT